MTIPCPHALPIRRIAILGGVPNRGALGDAAVVRRLDDRLGLDATSRDLDAGIAVSVEATLAKLLTTDEPAPRASPTCPRSRTPPPGTLVARHRTSSDPSRSGLPLSGGPTAWRR